ncbi:chemotaxis protein CheW [Paenibacillus koleovorans]|uniref:chemotaxis protein CheW n=1 Tax=Paenibacillus koleovorans TaxID=121608 RepID=UPI0013E2F537|nr:chemotaxis protein CheW [Paenibacillus koleovorans]
MLDTKFAAYMNVFLDEYEEQLHILDGMLLELETSGNQPSTIQTIFRAAHTLKGSSSAMGFERVKQVTHKVESIFDLLRTDKLQLQPGLVNLLFRSVDYLKAQRERFVQGQFEEEPVEVLLQDLEPARFQQEQSKAAAVIGEQQDPALLAAGSFSAEQQLLMAERLRQGDAVVLVQLAMKPEEPMAAARALLIFEELKSFGALLACSPSVEELRVGCEGRERFACVLAGTSGVDAMSRYLADRAELSRVRCDTVESGWLLGGGVGLNAALETAVAVEAVEAGVVLLTAAETGVSRAAGRGAGAGMGAGTEVAQADVDTKQRERDSVSLAAAFSAASAAAVTASAEASAAVAAAPSPGKFQANQTVRVDVSRLEHLLNLVGELIIDKTRLEEAGKQLRDKLAGAPEVVMLGDIIHRLTRTVGDLQDGMMKTRMLPIEQLFSRFPRLVRDLMQMTGKEIALHIEGNETELDRTLIEEISDPLIHILRNAADHGLETPEERERLGKPRKGTIHLKATHQENAVVISVTDDGRGIDPARIKQKAIEKGFLTMEEANRLTDRELIMLIFHSGMSMAERVTDLSGRGVGMDIVRSHIEKLNGVIDIQTELGKGTVFTIKLPLTLAIIGSLLVGLEERTFALPMVNVIEIFRVQEQDVQTVHGRDIFKVRGEIVPLLRLDRLLGIKRETEVEGEREVKGNYAVMIGMAEKRVCLLVDRPIANQEIVMKSLGRFIGQVPYVAGSTIMGDGSVAVILDVGSIIQQAGTMKESMAADRASSGGKPAKGGAAAEAVETKLVTFRLDGESYGLPIREVKEIITVPDIRKVADAERCLSGIIDLRGELLPVYALRESLGLRAAVCTPQSRVIIASVGGSDVGLIVDQVTEVISLREDDIAPPPAAAAGNRGLMKGVYRTERGLIMLLRLERMIPAGAA